MSGTAKMKLLLPKSVLSMKFMKRTKERIEKELENNEDHKHLNPSDEISSSTGNYISEPSFISCEKLIEGRVSFKGMNPEIERLMELENGNVKEDGSMQKDISDEDMLKVMRKFNMKKRVSSTPSRHNIPTKKKK